MTYYHYIIVITYRQGHPKNDLPIASSWPMTYYNIIMTYDLLTMTYILHLQWPMAYYHITMTSRHRLTYFDLLFNLHIMTNTITSQWPTMPCMLITCAVLMARKLAVSWVMKDDNYALQNVVIPFATGLVALLRRVHVFIHSSYITTGAEKHMVFQGYFSLHYGTDTVTSG